VYEFGPFCIDPDERILFREGATVPLPPKAFDLLLLLVRNSGRTLEKDELMKAIWADAFVEEANLAQTMSVLRKCLGENPEDRAYIETLPRRGYRFLARVEVKSAPVSPPATQQQEKSRKPVAAICALIAVAVLAIAGTGFLIRRTWFRTDTTGVTAYKFTPLVTDAGLQVQPSWASNGKTIAYAGEVNGILQIFTKTLGSSMSTQITTRPEHCFFPIWSHDGTHILFVSGMDLWSIGAAGGEPALLIANVTQASMSPDGRTLALVRTQGPVTEIWTSSPPGAPPKRYSEPPFANLYGHIFWAFQSFSPDNSLLGVSLLLDSSTPQFWILPFPNGKPVQVLPDLRSNPLMPGMKQFSWMPDSRQVVFAQCLLFFANPHLWVADTKTGRIRALTDGAGAEQAPAVYLDASRIAFASIQGTYDLVEVPLDGSSMRDFLVTSRNEITPSWSPLGAHVAYVTDRSGAPEIWLKNIQENWERPIVTQNDFGTDRTFLLLDVCFSPDGQRIAYRRLNETGEAVWISTIAGGPPVRLALEPNNGYQRGPAWSPDGNWIAYYAPHSATTQTLMKVHLGGKEGPIVIKSDVGIYPRWSPRADSILSGGPALFVTPVDGKVSRKVSDRTYMIDGWSKDGSLIFGIRGTETRRLVLESINPITLEKRLIADFGPVPASADLGTLSANTPFRGFSMNPDGKSFLTSVFRATSDIWLLEAFR
jgi:Tol biopolymer transport system component/DNA-binding winged helix-turn-helix (wHTH) protein